MMTEQKINTALDLTFELEGLLMMMRERSESAPDEVSALISEKIAALAAIAGVVTDAAMTTTVTETIAAAEAEALPTEVAAPESVVVEPERPLTLNDRYRIERDRRNESAANGR